MTGRKLKPLPCSNLAETLVAGVLADCQAADEIVCPLIPIELGPPASLTDRQSPSQAATLAAITPKKDHTMSVHSLTTGRQHAVDAQSLVTKCSKLGIDLGELLALHDGPAAEVITACARLTPEDLRACVGTGLSPVEFLTVRELGDTGPEAA